MTRLHTNILGPALLIAASTWISACGSADPETNDDAGVLAGGTDGGTPADAGSLASAETGGNGMGQEPSAGGGAAGSGGSFGAATGGTDATGGFTGSSGDAAAGGLYGTGGEGGEEAPPEVDGEGCPLTQEGFSTLDANGQNGTTGGLGGEIVTVTNQADLNRYVTAVEPYVIRVQGKIVIAPKGTEFRVASDKTIVGVGSSGEISEGGFFLAEGVRNVIIRNLTIGDTYKADDPDGKTQDWDGVQMDTAHHVWIDHCDFHHIGDGMIDSRKDTTNITVSWSILRDHNKAFGVGWTENLTAEMTIHHNILRNTQQRNPSTDNVLRAHLFNNWMSNITSYGNYARGGTHMVLENSVFENVNNPHYYDTGSLVSLGNVYTSTSGQKESSGTTYSFFDPATLYEYVLDPTGQVKSLLTQCAGPRATLP